MRSSPTLRSWTSGTSGDWVVPGWPGEEAYLPQAMVSQTRAVLEAYARNGGVYREEAIEDCGHSPHVEKPEAFRRAVFGFLKEQAGGDGSGRSLRAP